MTKAIIFDFFGVIGLSTSQFLVEKYHIGATGDKKILLEDLHKALDNGYIEELEFFREYADILGLDYETFMSDLSDAQARGSVSDEMIEFIRELRKKYKVGLLSNVSQESYLSFIEPISSEFDAVVASYAVKLAKPSEAIFEYAASKLEIDVSDCVMIDDIEANCEGARAAGMEAIRHASLVGTRMQLKNLLGVE